MNECIIYIKDNEITNRKALVKFFEEVKQSDGRYIIKSDHFKKRTLPQNAYYHGVVVPMVRQGLRDAGYNEVKTNDDAHEIMKHLFLKKKLASETTGDEIVIAGSTATLKTVEFNEYLESIWQWAASYLNLIIPEPNQQTALQL